MLVRTASSTTRKEKESPSRSLPAPGVYYRKETKPNKKKQEKSLLGGAALYETDPPSSEGSQLLCGLVKVGGVSALAALTS